MKRGKGKWSCPHNCDQAAWLKRTGHGCKHLEALMSPVIGQDSRRIVFSGEIERQAFSPSSEELLIKKEIDDRHDSIGWPERDEENELRTKLLSYDLPAKRVEVVLDRLLHGRTFKEIAMERGYSRAQGARQAYEDAKEFLAKKGFKK